MKGHIRCAKCGKARTSKQTACECGEHKCRINVYWHGKHYNYYSDRHYGLPFSYDTAAHDLEIIREGMINGSFNPADYTKTGFTERLLENKTNEWLKDKEDDMNAGEFSFGTYRNYASYTRTYLKPLLGKYDVREIRFEQLDTFKKKLKNVSIKTRKNILNGLHAFYVWLKSKKVIVDLPEFPTIEGDDAKKQIALTPDQQYEVLLRVPEAHRDAIEFAIETGIRIGELCALKLKDINLKQGICTIQRTWTSHVLKESTKANHKDDIPLSDRALEIVKKHTMTRLSDGMVDISVFDQFLFINPTTGRGYRVAALRRAWRVDAKAPVTFHEGTRHSFCTQVVETNTDVFSAQQLMRHTNINMTRKYFHSNVDRLRSVVNKRGKVVSTTRPQHEQSNK